MGLFIHFYIIFGNNQLTGGPAQIIVFCLFQCFTEKEYQTESKQNETFGSVIFWNKRDPEDLEWTSSNQQGSHEEGERAYPPGCALHPRGPLVAPPTYFLLLYIRIYPENIQDHNRSGVPPPQAFVATKNQSGPCSGTLLEGGGIHHRWPSSSSRRSP